MNIDLTKFVKNKDLKISNDDFDLEGLSNAYRKGYVKESEAETNLKNATKGMVKREDFDKLQSDYSTLETNYNNNLKTLSDTNEKMAEISFNSKLAENHFNKKDYKEVREIRNSIFKDTKDDDEAIKNIAEKFKATYFPETQNKATFTPSPNEGTLTKSNGNSGNEIHITRNTHIKDLLVK